MGVNVTRSSEYEAEANRLRMQIDETVDALRFRLTPSNLASETASRAGIADLSWRGAFDFASRRHPIPTAVIALGVALWTMSALRKRKGHGSLAALAAPMKDSSHFDSSTRRPECFGSEPRRSEEEFVGVAQSQVARGAAMLSDEIERTLGDVIDRAPGGMNARPMIEAAIQVALASVLEGLLRRHSRL